jgi:AraC-like DNA-binding protein
LFYSYFEIKLTPFAENLNIVSDYFFVINDFYLLTYLLLTLKLLSTYNKAAKSIYSNLKDKELRWVKYFIVSGIFIIIVDIFTYVYDYFYTEQELNSAFVTVSFIVIMLFFLGYYGIKQSKILVPEFLLNPATNKESSVNVIKMDSIEIEERISKIKEVLSKERLFLDEDLTLNKLATKVSLSDKKLSAIINQEMDTSFYDLVNSFRIEEFKKRVVSEEFDNLTILGIAYDCGFKTKSTFNRLFKLNTGMSPSEYKKNENNFS